jgi:3-methyladenine DNA glycosylase AlkD
MSSYKHIHVNLKKIAVKTPRAKGVFFKTGPGEYAEKDKFLGVPNPILRQLAKMHKELPITEIQSLLKSIFNEERMLALFILVLQYQKALQPEKEKIFKFYLQHLKYVNNWNLVDASAHLIIGCHLLGIDNKKDKNILLTLSKSTVMWERRIAIVSTWYFIRHDQHDWTFKIAKVLLKDEQDLIHKAVGWMLREVGKKNIHQLIEFLERHAHLMPRTMLRYAIEKFPEAKRKAFLLL